jgi:hypothetical protein
MTQGAEVQGAEVQGAEAPCYPPISQQGVLTPCLLASLLCVAFAVLMHTATHARRLHPDEAFFMTFARNASVGGDWWLRGALDKPPLTIYANALLLMVVGIDQLPNGVLTLDVYQGEFVSRLLGVGMGMVWLASLMTISQRLFKHERTTLLIAFSLACSPVFVAYSASAFMDVPMMALASLAVAGALWGKTRWSGVCFGLALLAKPQAIIFFPLLLWLLYYQRLSLRRWLSPLIVIGVIAILWDVARGETSVWALGASNNAMPVLYMRYGLLILPFWAMLWGKVGNRCWTRYNIFFAMWTLITLLPLIALRDVRVQAWLYDTPTYCEGNVCVAPNAQIDQLAQYLNAKPIASVVYDHWLGWQLRYYMGQWTDKRLVYYPSPHAMTHDALKLAESGTRYWLMPNNFLAYYGLSSSFSTQTHAWLVAWQEAGFEIRPKAYFGNITVYALTPP